MTVIGNATPGKTACRPARPPISTPPPHAGQVPFGTLRRLEPMSRVFGLDRGRCIDRYYIERFLECRAGDICGHVLEIADDNYTRRFGGDRVTHTDVLHVAEGNRKATLIGDLTCGEQFPQDAYDCIILTQTLQHIYDARAAIGTLYRILKSGGVVLATVPGISQISRYDMDRWGDYWRFTSLSVRRLFEEAFPREDIEVTAFGNVLAGAAFLYGLAVEEMDQEELDHRDPDYELLIAARARRPDVPQA